MTARTTLRSGLAAPPATMRNLRFDSGGFPVPWNVAWTMGVPDHELMDTTKIAVAIKEHRCWECGEPMRRFKTFVVTAADAIDRSSPHPPAHRDCAEYVTTVLKRRPGVRVLWTTIGMQVYTTPAGAMRFRMADPVVAAWYCDGESANRETVMDAIAATARDLAKYAEANGIQAVMSLGTRTGLVVALAPVADRPKAPAPG